jgi:CDP-diacylglycerol--glycerol-3-phosphate 3-phosphatidyltransferase
MFFFFLSFKQQKNPAFDSLPSVSPSSNNKKHAPQLQITSAFGAFLDPVADKIMVTTALVLMAAAPPAPLTTLDLAIPVALIICREITMSSLREWAAASGGGAHKAVKVNSLGKWKTALQMVAMSAMLVLRRAEGWLPLRPRTPAGRAALARTLSTGMWASLALLWAGAFLAVLSLYYYMANVWHYFLYPDGGGGPHGAQGVRRASAAGSPARPPAPAPAAAAAAAAALANGNGAAAAPAALRPRTRRAAAGR